ncbi:MAG: DNA-processing protein DprA [Acidimicrobiia bacterium]
MAESHRLGPDRANYPVGLLDLEDPPSLFVVGNLRQESGVAVVGTRRCTRYGLDLAQRFGSVLAKCGWSTVSGLARGIDAAAHQGALESGGHAVAVLGCGIDVVYPKENERLFDRVSQTGALLSEYPPGTPPDRWRFPARNRIIAAISSAVVVVEAAEKGGALITARLAAEIGRPVFVVPGDIDRKASVGCNRLIRDGAFPVLGPDDLVEELSLIMGPPPRGSLQSGNATIPSEGLLLDELPHIWSCSPSEALSRVGRMEMDGQIVRSGDRIVPR